LSSIGLCHVVSRSVYLLNQCFSNFWGTPFLDTLVIHQWDTSDTLETLLVCHTSVSLTIVCETQPKNVGHHKGTTLYHSKCLQSVYYYLILHFYNCHNNSFLYIIFDRFFFLLHQVLWTWGMNERKIFLYGRIVIQLCAHDSSSFNMWKNSLLACVYEWVTDWL